MTDIHSHILFNLDDGSKSVEESIELLSKMESIGFDNVILTPHYIESSNYSKNNEEKEKLFNELKKSVKKNKLNINIFLGNEVFINNNVVKLIKNNEIHCLSNSKYVLIEIPRNNQILNLDDIFYNIKYNGYIPVLAHPERYTYFQKNYKMVKKLKEDGIFFQVNYSSIIGDYGYFSKRLVKKLYKDRYVDFIGTDIHHINQCNTFKKFDEIKRKIKKITGEEYFNEIMSNCDMLIK